MRARSLAAAGCLAVAIGLTGALPSVPPPARAVSCSGWSSEAEPPPTIRVYRTATGVVDTVDLRSYVDNVLSREWIASWSPESIRAGAIAVKSYAWYFVLHWRGLENAAGQCFDVFDSTRDQVYDPARPTHPEMTTAVDATWSWRVLRDGRIFPTYYNAGDPGEPCGANRDGARLWQWGSQACGLAGRSAAEILTIYYYPGVTVPVGPSPTPSPTASPTPAPTATAVPTPTPSPGPPSLRPTPVPVPTADPGSPSPAPFVPPADPRLPRVPTPAPASAHPGGGPLSPGLAPGSR